MTNILSNCLESSIPFTRLVYKQVFFKSIIEHYCTLLRNLSNKRRNNYFTFLYVFLNNLKYVESCWINGLAVVLLRGWSLVRPLLKQLIFLWNIFSRSSSKIITYLTHFTIFLTLRTFTTLFQESQCKIKRKISALSDQILRYLRKMSVRGFRALFKAIIPMHSRFKEFPKEC